MTGTIKHLSCVALAAVLALPSTAWASSAQYGVQPPAFNRDQASSIGRARQHYDRRLYDQYRGNPGAQFELRQKRQNLCRNNPEMC